MVPQLLSECTVPGKKMNGIFLTIGGPNYQIQPSINDPVVTEVELDRETIADMLSSYFSRNLAYCN